MALARAKRYKNTKGTARAIAMPGTDLSLAGPMGGRSGMLLQKPGDPPGPQRPSGRSKNSESLGRRLLQTEPVVGCRTKLPGQPRGKAPRPRPRWDGGNPLRYFGRAEHLAVKEKAQRLGLPAVEAEDRSHALVQKVAPT